MQQQHRKRDSETETDEPLYEFSPPPKNVAVQKMKEEEITLAAHAVSVSTPPPFAELTQEIY